MLPSDGGGSPRQPRRRRRRQDRRPSLSPLPQTARGPFGGPRTGAPFERQQEEAKAKTQRAQRKVPERPLPHVPTLNRPTARQTQAAKKLILRTLGPGGGSKGQAARAERVQELEASPRGQSLLALARYYQAHEENAQAARVARGAGVKGTRAQQVRAGRALIRRQLMRDRVSRAPAPTQLKVAGVGAITPSAIGKAIMGATSLAGDTAENRLVRNAGGDVKALAEAPFVGGYTLGKAAVQDVASRALGHRGDRTAHATADIATAVAKNLAHEAQHPGKAFQEHPLLTLLDALGVASVAGHTAGAIARGAGSTVDAAGARGALARAGSTARSPIALVDDAGAAKAGQVVERRYSKDLGRKLVQVLSDQLREPVRDAEGKTVTVQQGAREVPVVKATQGVTVRSVLSGTDEQTYLQRRAMDFGGSRANSVERMVRDQAAHEMRVRGIRGRRAQDLVALVAQGAVTTARHFEDDLHAYTGMVRKNLVEHDRQVRAGETPTIYRHGGDLEAARHNLETAERSLRDPRVLAQKEKIAEVGIDIGRRLVEGDVESEGLGLIDPRAARRSRLVVPAITHLKARHYSEDELVALERAGVPVRHPQRVAEHQAAQQKVRDAREKEKRATVVVRELREERARLVGGQRVKRGQEAQKGPLRAYYVGERRFETAGEAAAYAKGNGGKVRSIARTSAEASREGELARVERLLATRTREARTARRARAKAEADLRGTPKPPLRASLRGEGARFLSNREVEDFLRSRGRDPETVAYLPHRMDVRGSRAFHSQFRPGSRPQLDTGPTRTGSAYAKGATESSADLIRDQGVRQRVLIAKAQQLDRLVGDHGLKRPDGAYYKPREAAEMAQRIEKDTGQRLTPMRAFAAKLDADTRRVIREDLQGPGGMETLGLRLLNQRVATAGTKGARNVVLVPEEMVKQLERHLAPAGPTERFFQFLNRPFRFAVLPQPRWLTGNFAEPYIVRLTVAGSGLNVFGLAVDIAAFEKTVRAMERSSDPARRAAAEEIRAHGQGGLFGGNRGASTRRTAEELPGPLKYAAIVRDLPVIRQGWDLLKLMPDSFFRFNRTIEAPAQGASIGKSIRRDIQEFTGSWLSTLRLHGKALEEAQRGLTNTPTQARFMRAQHELLGKYEGYPPWLRRVIQGPMPFLPWTLNAARFVFWTMPAHHTALTALLIKVNDVVAQDWKDIHANTPPGSLRLAIPTARGGWVDLARYTPYGLTGPIAEGEVGNITDPVLPQLSGAYEAIHGRDPFDRALAVDPSENEGESKPNAGQRVGIAGYGLAEALIPYLSTIRRLREGGGTAYAGSTVLDPDMKPGTSHMSAARRTFDPFRPTYLSAPSSGSVGSSQPRSRLDSLLERRAALLERSAAGSARLDDLLERRARLLGP